MLFPALSKKKQHSFFWNRTGRSDNCLPVSHPSHSRLRVLGFFTEALLMKNRSVVQEALRLARHPILAVLLLRFHSFLRACGFVPGPEKIRMECGLCRAAKKPSVGTLAEPWDATMIQVET